ncbi:MAG TPA: zinc-dependent alcohol dehydrogenase family protein [Anaeromyxobacter sp.]|nr:zinc-dependent alcohol dehydrogenase family protein [Anaeromyxobacter sp.]
MKALVIEKPGQAHVVEVPRPEPKPGEVLIRVERSGICGTDVHIFRGEYLGSYPVTPGHEFSGVVEALGPGARRFAVGDRVAVEPNISCDACPTCLSNRQNFCEGWKAVGVTLPGGMAEYTCAPEKAVFAIGDLPFSAGAFVEPLSCVLHGVQRVAPQLADRVLVVGAGPIGVLLLQAVLATGASAITVVDKNASRLALASAAGGRTVTTLASLDEVPRDAFEVVIDATGVPAVMQRCVEWAAPGGRALLFGVPPSGARLSLDAFAIFRKGLSVLSSYTSVRNSLQAVRLLQSGRIDVRPLVSHELPLERFVEGVELIERGAPGVLKILITPGVGRA